MGFFLFSSAIHYSVFRLNPSVPVTMGPQYTPEFLHPLDFIQINPEILLIVTTNSRANSNLLTLL